MGEPWWSEALAGAVALVSAAMHGVNVDATELIEGVPERKLVSAPTRLTIGSPRRR
jgi:hypothetical protein